MSKISEGEGLGLGIDSQTPREYLEEKLYPDLKLALTDVTFPFLQSKSSNFISFIQILKLFSANLIYFMFFY